MGEAMTDQRFGGTLVQAFSPGYESIEMTTYRDPALDLAWIQVTARHLQRDNLSHSNKAKGKIAGRGVSISAEPAVVAVTKQNTYRATSLCPPKTNPPRRNLVEDTPSKASARRQQEEPPGAKTGPEVSGRGR